jgi:hypothetical protein
MDAPVHKSYFSTYDLNGPVRNFLMRANQVDNGGMG